MVYRKGMKKMEKPSFTICLRFLWFVNGSIFSSTRLSLMDRGFIYVIAHIRGGEDLGREWYENGKLLKKKNTFTDFIDCSKFLIAENIPQPNIYMQKVVLPVVC